MKKLKLDVADLEVRSFDPQKPAGQVHGMMAITQQLGCTHTGEVDCYPSKYCTGTGCVATAAYTCMTASNSPC